MPGQGGTYELDAAYPGGLSPLPGLQEVAASLSLGQIVELEDALSVVKLKAFNTPDNPWLRILNKQSRGYERNLEDLRTYRLSEPESPDYDPKKGAVAYINRIRETNLTEGLHHAIGRQGQVGWMGPQRDRVNALAAQYVYENSNDLQFILGVSYSKGGLSHEESIEFLALNTRNIVFAPRSMAAVTYEERKRDIIRSHLPGMVFMSAQHFLDRAKLLDVTKGQLEAIRAELETLPYETELPDFFQLELIHQGAILGTIGVEWTKLCQLIQSIDPRLLTTRNNRLQAPLSFHRFEDLRSAIMLNPDLPPSEVCKIFLKHPAHFRDVLAETKEVYEIRRRDMYGAATRGKAQSSEADTSPQSEKAAPLSPNMIRIQNLLDDPNVNEGILDLAYGETLEVTELNRIIPRKEFDKVVDKHVELIGRAMWEGMQDKSKRGLKLERWGQFNIGDSLRGKFNGALRNLKITRLPISSETFTRLFGENYDAESIRPENVSLLVFEVEMKSTGRRGEPAVVSVPLVVRKGRTHLPDAVYKAKSGSSITGGMDTALSMRMDSEARARALEIHNRLRLPLWVGLPSLGRSDHVSATRRNR